MTDVQPQQPPQPQIIYVQAPPPVALTPIQQAQLDNTAAWRTAGIVSIVLLLTFFFAWAIPIILLVVLIQNGARMNRAQREQLHGSTPLQPAPALKDDNSARWALAAIAALVALLALVAGINGNGGPVAVLIGLAAIVGAVLLQPWRPTGRDSK